MNITQFETVAKNQLSTCEKLLTSKGEEYALQPDVDRLDHFKVAGAITGGTPKTALWGMLAKHLVSLSDMCTSKDLFSEERWDEKITDSINYLMLLKALAMEERESSIATITIPKVQEYQLEKLEAAHEKH